MISNFNNADDIHKCKIVTIDENYVLNAFWVKTMERKPTINEMYLSFFRDVPYGKEFTRHELVLALEKIFNAKRDSILPSDYCYNSSNVGVEGRDRLQLFIKTGRGKYIYVGPDYDPNGINPYEYGTINSSFLQNSDPIATIDEETLDKSMKWFVDYVTVQQGCSDISFQVGWLAETEGYKKEIYENSHRALKIDNWSSGMIGTGEIIKYVLEGFKQKSNKGFNNIVQFQSLTEFKNKAESNVKKAEDILFRLFKEDDPSVAFDDACDFWGKRFPELSYLMFMKDNTRYLPVKTKHHIKSFDLLNIDTRFLKTCSWDNYSVFLQIHRIIRDRLEEYLGMDVSLVDAHSFVWVLQKAPIDFMDQKAINEVELVEDDDPYTSVVVKTGKEGKITYHYVATYERKPQNRTAAIKIHGCKCMACGFDFEKEYGELGKGFIEVHHVKPLYTLNDEIEVDPRNDLICVCSNCHRMIHKKRGSVLSLEELIDILNAQKN